MGKKIALVVIAILLIANLAVVAMLMNRNSEPAPAATPTPAATAAPTPEPTAAPTPTPELEIDPNAGALITPTPAPQEPGIAIPGWGSITLPAGVTEAQVALKNPEDNADWYYLTFELRLPKLDEETGEEGYEVV
ncbi:MAG: hypothetical protein Q4F08_10025, partial [Rikenellaceae bacterium]|nr:hypothetical protein [Rikenellaceae bacterium]